MFESKTFPITVKRIRNMLTKINISVISLMMFYEHSKTIMCIVIGDLIYTIIDNYICLDDMGPIFFQSGMCHIANKKLTYILPIEFIPFF